MICRICSNEAAASRMATNMCESCVADALRVADHIGQSQTPGFDPTKVPKYGAGDFVANITKAMGIPQCGGCAKRRKAMNTVDLSSPAIQVFSGLAKAILSPDKVLNEDEEAVSIPEESSEGRGQGEGAKERGGKDSAG